ncbi:MAG: hypothetical protein NWR72_06300 [Bacteroidia bacterium]|nr:hypothetical protein [Bacteroidia bacterium]
MNRFSTFFLAAFFWTASLSAQQFETFYDSGELQSRTPINEAGEFDGLGLEYYANGVMAAEVPYVHGKVTGIVKEYYPDGQLKLQHEFANGKKQGKMYLYDADGSLRIFALMQADSVLFSQRYDGRGRLVAEKVGFFPEPIDTTNWEPPIVWLAEGGTLSPDQPNLANIFIPGFPTSFLSYASPSGTIEASHREDFPLLLTPTDGQSIFVLYLRIKLHTRAQASVLKRVELQVVQP